MMQTEKLQKDIESNTYRLMTLYRQLLKRAQVEESLGPYEQLQIETASANLV